MAAERARAAALAEPDRLEGFSAPREVDRLFGHAAARGEFADAVASGRMHHAWLIVGPEGIGKATLAYHFARMVLAEAGGREGIDREHPVFRKVAALSHPNLLVHPSRLEREVEALCANDRRRRGQALARLSRYDGGRGKLACRHCRSRRRAEPERGECAVEGAGRAATPDFVPADLERRGTASRHHPFAQPDAARLGLGGGGSDRGGARRSRSRRAGGGRQGARHRTCAERWQRAPGARTRLERGHRALRRNRRRTRRLARDRRCAAASQCREARRHGRYRAARALSRAAARADRAADPLHGDGRGRHARGAEPGQAAHFAGQSFRLGGSLGGDFRGERARRLALNLDRSLLVLDTWFRLQSVVREHPV